VPRVLGSVVHRTEAGMGDGVIVRPGCYVEIVFPAGTRAPETPHLHYECPSGKDGPHLIVETTGRGGTPNVRVIAACTSFESARAVARLHGEDVSPKVIDCYDDYGFFGYGVPIDYRRITGRRWDK